MTPQPLAVDDTQAIRAVIELAVQSLQSDHFDDYFDLFTDDAVWMIPSRFQDIGIDEARSFYGFTDKFRFDQRLTIDEIMLAGDWAFVRISLDGHLRAKSDLHAAPLRSISRHMWILQRQQDGSWMIARDIWNNPKSNKE
ncbi:MAG: nuclear transport factor 2 family protein [Pseudomonadales bacterium]|jgi:ketosteroid isomerase-like protein|nr:nuclear transport factor 2 family protein [Pseudomonadales bacterium]MDP7360307.1 nuclear transport factor 2 family protein [Pseudomonadales bacterium]MDP7597581.1 nuclear transport factor 2 family protein [Pseudomonadales bacterium]HJN50795.1 nuclear transport factor 2 family protein [Pseudomonadales bacterium]|tara:strand:- start:832 stop:1251 length:420 start_codon:yes stop_codon:yes gene_type:complete